MKPIMIAAFTCATLWAATCASAQSADPVAGKVVGPGVTWSSEFKPAGPLNYNVMRVEIDNPLVTLEMESGQDELFAGEKTLDSAKREEEAGATEIIGGVNADFWSNSPQPFSPVGLLVADGMIYNMPAKGRSAFVFTDNEDPYIGPITLEVSLTADGKKLNIDRINSGTKSKDEIVLFTPPYGETVEAESGKRFQLAMNSTEFLPNQPVEVSITEVDSDLITPLSEETLVLYVPPGRVDDLPGFAENQSVTLSAELPQVDGVVNSVCGGGPSIVSDGKVNVKDEGMGESFSETKHPRTALGISKDEETIFLVTVDGRQPRISVGNSLDELAQYMVGLGCWEAINLDGGGSTSMVVNDKIVNHPSDFKGPRTVANSLLVVAEAGSGKAATLSFDPAGQPLVVPTGATLDLEISALDENSIPVPLESGVNIQAGKSDLVKNVELKGNQATVTFSEIPGSGTIEFSLGDAEGNLPIQVVTPDVIVTEPDVLVLGTGESVKLHATALVNGEKISLTPEMVEMSSADATVATISDNVANGLKKGKTQFNVRVGTSAKAIPVYVDLAEKKSLAGFENVEDHTAIEGSGFDEAGTKVSLDSTKVKKGKGSAKVVYAMAKGDRSRINIPIGAEITEAPAGFSIWVFGDGQEAWLRANFVDSNGALFIADFTNGADGITWKNEWKHLTVPYQALIGTDFGKSARPAMPLKVDHIVIAQDQEVLKRSGEIYLDAFEAFYPPAEQREKAE